MTFIYLYDINCIYHKIDFKNSIDLKERIEKILETNNFGEDIKILSDFISAPAMFLNHYMRRAKITEYSVFDVKYDPKFKTAPCDEVTFDFDININDNYNISLSIHKIDRPSNVEELDTYKLQFKFMDEVKSMEIDTITNIHYTIGSKIAEILDNRLKS